MKTGIAFLNNGTIDMANHKTVYIGDYVTLGGNSRIITHYPIRSFREDSKIKIGDYTYIGYGCLILPGVKIGNLCIIGAGSVLSSDIPDFHTAAGNPCKPIRKRTWDELEHYLRIFYTRCNHKKTMGTSEPLPLSADQEDNIKQLRDTYHAS